MHKIIINKFLIALIVLIPGLSVAADGTPAGEPKADAPAQASASALQPVTTESKPPETTPVQHSAKIGYVDIIRIGSESGPGKALKTTLISRQNLLQGKIDTKKKDIEKFKTATEAKISTMTPQQREATSKEFQKKLEDYQKFVRISEEEFSTLQEKETRALYEEIEKSAVAHGKANGFSLVVVKKELLYVGNAVDAQDVTEALIKALNETVLKK
jgi:outer membrane protein